jgi:8-oxo-dGTP diphosphatase
MTNKYDTARPYTASYIIFRRGSKIAFLLRANTGWMNGYYGLPAGKVEIGETFTHATIREAKEEVGVDLTLDDIKYVHTTYRNEDADSDMEWVDVYFEVVTDHHEPFNAEPDMHGELAWLDISDPADAQKIIPSSLASLQHIADGKQFSEYVAI